MEAMTRKQTRGFPWLVFTALDGGASDIFDECPRKRDAWSDYWLKKYPTPKDLESKESLACLGVIARKARDYTTRVEVRHGNFQAEMKAKAVHVTPVEFPFVSAMYFVQRQRGLSREHWSSSASIAAHTGGPRRPKRKKKHNAAKKSDGRAASWKL